MSPLLKKLERIFRLTPEEKTVLGEACTEQRTYEARQDLIRTGDRPWRSNLLLEGMVCRYRNLGGGKRQILAFQYPGDVFDAYSFILEVMDHNIATIARSTIAYIPHEKMWEIIEHHPRVARALWKDTLIDGAVFAEWMTNSRKKQPRERVAHLLCEICVRFDVVGLSKDSMLNWPITFDDLEAALGLPSDLVEKIFDEFRASGWIGMREGRLQLIDPESLKQLAGFDPTYLHLDQPVGPAGRLSTVEWVKPL